MSIARWSRWTIGAAGLVLALTACDVSGPRSALEPVGPVAQRQMELFMLTFWWGLVVWVVVTAGLVYAMWRYRRRPDQEGIPSQIHGEARLEAAWTIGPAIILVLIGVPTVAYIFESESYVEPTPEDVVINVVGHQWWWELEYPEQGIVTANEMHIPVGRRVVLSLKTDDVLHSFWAPKLAGKRDLIPNQDNQLWFVADEPGVFGGHCAEFCLGPHAFMRFQVIAHPEEEFAAWVEAFQESEAQGVAAQKVAQAEGGQLVQEGAQLFQTKGCAGCHAIRGVAYGQIGPDLTNFGMRNTIAAGVLENTPENLARWIDDPQGVKPGNYMPDLGVSGEELDALVAYLESLGRSEEPQASAGGNDGTR